MEGIDSRDPKERQRLEPLSGKFDAEAYAVERDDPSITVEDVLAEFPEDTKSRLEEVQKLIESREETAIRFMVDGAYTEERTKLHGHILDDILSEERIEAATPKTGRPKLFVILGGRGGSGKSWFEGNVYDENYLVLDADDIKKRLPEYEGWNAAEVHTESGHIFDLLVETARTLGLNVVLDKTMKTVESSIRDVEKFKSAGYMTKACYMFLPRQKAAKRAVERFLGPTKRYVPIEIVLSNRYNEANFDKIKIIVHEWEFYDNDVERNQPPDLVAKSS